MPTDAMIAPAAGLFGAPRDAGVSVRWLGTAGFSIEYAGHVLLIDPYVTRTSLARAVASPLVSDREAVALHAPRADAIVVGHTHFDHALDVPAIALQTGARVFGSSSAASLCRGAGVAASHVIDVQSSLRAGTYEAEIGPFFLRFHPSAHSRLILGKVPLPGDIDDCDAFPMRLHRYRCGAVFAVEIRVAGRTLFHLGSAELVEQALGSPRGREVDLLLLCVAGWTKSERFPERALAALSPRAVLLSHWDDFFRPLASPVRALPALKLPQLIDRLSASSRDTKIATLDLLGHTLI